MATPKSATPAAQSETIRNHAAFIWSVADLLRGDYKRSEYGKVILPLTVIRRLDCVLEPTKEAVLKRHKSLRSRVKNVDKPLEVVAEQDFYNVHPLTFGKLLDDPGGLADSLKLYIGGFSATARDIIDKFEFENQIDRLKRANLLYEVVSRFAEIDLHPEVVSNIEMGYIYEELIRKFSELSNETAGEHFTPREVIRLMVNLLFVEDKQELSKRGIVKTMCDPACGTGGMLSVAEDHLREINSKGRLEVFGQELNAETYAICRSDMMLKGQNASHIAFGNSFSEDHHDGERFDYLLANPPFGVEWKKVKGAVDKEAAVDGFGGRFGAGLPRITDGSFLFLQHMIAKMKAPEEGGSRVAIVFNGSPLFAGGAESGESEIRRWIIENDWLEAVVALPDQLFYNTGISTYFWVVTNRKAPERRGKVQLVDAREDFVKMRKSLGDKRQEISDKQIEKISGLYRDFKEGEKVKIFPNEAFGFLRITVERPLRLRWEVTEETIAAAMAKKQLQKLEPKTLGAVGKLLRKHRDASYASEEEVAEALGSALADLGLKRLAQKAVWSGLGVRDEGAPVVTDRKGEPEPDPELRDSENVPLPPTPVEFEQDPAERLDSTEYRAAIDDYMREEVIPYVPDAWVDYEKTKIGYEIPLTRHFYKYVPPRPLEEIDEEIKGLEEKIQRQLTEVAG
ncbi:MAG TPA: class I SAM-dependent DNA methyltransferase [Solirubrobacterales bacterium]